MPAFPSNHYKVLDGLVKAAVLFSAYEVWREVISDTMHGNAIDYTAKRIGCSHQGFRILFFVALLRPPKVSGRSL